MKVTFRRTGLKRYSIAASRKGEPDLVMDPAPGYDELLPHDVLHLVVEAALGLTGGVFGQLAAGGDAGSFSIPHDPALSDRDVSRLRREVAKRGKRLSGAGKDESARSERATFVGWYEWLSRSDAPDHRRCAISMKDQARRIRELMPDDEEEALNRSLDTICVHLDGIASRWRAIDVGESITIEWPSVLLLDEC